MAGVAKVRPSKDFLRPLCQILDAQLSYFWNIYVRKIPKIDNKDRCYKEIYS